MEDCTQEWLFDDDAFSFVHMRYLYGSVEDWGALLREAYRVTEPGGWVESVEASPKMESDDNTIAEDCAMHQWGPIFIEGAREVGRTFTVVDDNLQLRRIREAGFTNIRVVDKKVSPVNVLSPCSESRRTDSTRLGSRSPSAVGPRTRVSAALASSSSWLWTRTVRATCSTSPAS